jgi:hypothetical protein
MTFFAIYIDLRALSASATAEPMPPGGMDYKPNENVN